MKNLQNYLIQINARIKRDIVDKKYLAEYESLKINELSDFKYKNNTAIIEYIKRDCNILCSCGETDLTWDSYKMQYNKMCKGCQYKEQKEKTKLNRKEEKTYKGSFLEIDEIIRLLKEINYIEYMGSGKQRAFLKLYPQLYHSILNATKNLDGIRGVSLRARILYINETPKITCECGLSSKFCNITYRFMKYCPKCTPKYPSIDYFKNKYPKNWEMKLEEDKKIRSEKNKGRLTLKWFIEKYGDIGEEMYKSHYDKILNSNTFYSKISQQLFWDIINKLPNAPLHDINFAENNKEFSIYLNEEEKHILKSNKLRIDVDFKYDNKIIEFNGHYWHSSKKIRDRDIERKKILESRGYEVMFVWEKEYRENPQAVVDRCVRFLNSNKVKFNDRFMIETINGFETFDNIINRGASEIIEIFTEKNSIKVSLNHKFVVNNKSILASKLKIGDYLETKSGLEYIVDIVKVGTEDVYDILHTNSHTYIANNINNHNCEFLGSSHTLLDSKSLESFESIEPLEIRDGKLKIYKYPEKGHQYICAVDSAKDGIDDFSVQIVDITGFKFEQVASAQLQIDYLLMPEYINDWCEYYNKPYLIIENNEGSGQSIADQMKITYEYENLHYDTKIESNSSNNTKSRKKYPGFRTTPKSRKLILQTLKLFIDNKNLKIYDKKTINQFYTFILINNKYQADENCKDDAVMSLAMIFAPFCSSKNFDDMKGLVDRLYNTYESEDTEDSENKNFISFLSIGSFDDGTDIELEEQKTYNGFIMEPDGFY